MNTIRLIRDVPEVCVSDRGPNRGMYALQRALRELDVPWLKIGGQLERDELAWVWCWLDKPLAIRCEIEKRPFILGPCVFFGQAERPGESHGEKFLLNASHCRLLFTESRWYDELIESHRGPRNTAPIALWPFPIDPMPDGPLTAKYDLLIYAKSGCEVARAAEPTLVEELQNAYPNHCLIRYGHFTRSELIDAARQSRACAYLSDSDRGPLALAEILLCGCPAVGIECGAPWIINGCNGHRVESLTMEPIIDAVERCKAIDRKAVRELAILTFDPAAVARRVVAALEPLAAA